MAGSRTPPRACASRRPHHRRRPRLPDWLRRRLRRARRHRRARCRARAGSRSAASREQPRCERRNGRRLALASSGAVNPPPGTRNLVMVVFDSLRYDSWVDAAPQNLAALGPVERRWSYATWTAPSHYNLLMGLLPHTSPPEVYASEYYKEDFL